jgi:hypothetical protein
MLPNNIILKGTFDTNSGKMLDFMASIMFLMFIGHNLATYDTKQIEESLKWLTDT